MISPEGKVVGPAVDMWMLGCIAYALTFGRYPFEREEQILKGDVTYPFEGYLTELIK